MAVVDIVLILFILFEAVLGFKRGFTKSLVSLFGTIIVVILAFILKNPVTNFLVLHLPFFDFWGVIKGISVLNIALYEALAFILVFSILMIVLKVLSLTTTIFEKILSMTIILGLPSKILGALLGAIKGFIVVFIALYIMSFPVFSENAFVKQSALQKPILENTPILSVFVIKTVDVMNEFSNLKENYQNTNNSNEFNLQTLDLFLKYDIVKTETVSILVSENKIHINGVENVINKYKEE